MADKPDNTVKMEGGGTLYRVKEDKYYAVSGTKGHKWAEVEVADEQHLEVDLTYYDKLKDDAIAQIEKFIPFDIFVKTKES